MTGQSEEGMGTTAKVVLIILGAGALLLLVCCGVGAWWGKGMVDQFKDSMTDDPAKIAEITTSIVDITIPDEYTPQMAMNFAMFGVQMKMCAYSRTGDAGGVLIMEMSGPQMGNRAQMKQQFQQSLRQQGQNQDLQVESTVTRTFTINGEECDFEFVKGKNTQNNQDMRQVMGVIPGKTGAAFLMVFETEENWDEAAIVRIIESMGGVEITARVEGEHGTESAVPEGASEAPGTSPSERAFEQSAPLEPIQNN